MSTNISRRRALQALAVGLGSTTLFSPSGAFAQAKRSLHLQTVGFTLGIHVPQYLAIRELLLQAGYAEPKVDRIESMQVIAQSIVAGSAEIGDTDVIASLRATEADANVSIVGLVYNSTSQVLLANADKIKSFADFKKPENSIALNSTGDFIYALVSGILSRHGIDVEDVTIIEIGGSGSRRNALLAGRVAAVPVHFDQADAVVKQGNYKVMVQPWTLYPRWFSEVWLVNRAWMSGEDNQRALVDFNKAMITAFRRATKDYSFFADGYRKYATIPGHADATDQVLRPIWQTLATEIHAWPEDGGFKREYFQELLPVYKKAHVLRGTINLDKAVEPRFVDQALQELG